LQQLQKQQGLTANHITGSFLCL